MKILHRALPPILAALVGSVVGAGTAQAQAARGWVSSTARFVQLHPLVADTIGLEEECLSTVPCSSFRTGQRRDAVALSQDASFIAWGLGVRGLSVTGFIRSRIQVAGEFDWPRADDRFDAILAYAEYMRGRTRVRVGRQRSTSTLGFKGYDGAQLRVAPVPALRIELFAGRSLAEALNEPRNQAFRGLEDFLVDQGAYVVGASADASVGPGWSMSGRYQREIYRDRSALLSERASLTVQSDPLARGFTLRGRLDYDLGTGSTGKAEVVVGLPSVGGWRGAASWRRYIPYFDLSTIWGYFQPVSYHEAALRVTRTMSPRLSVWGSGAVRRYGDTGTTTVLFPLKDSGWRVSSGGALALSSAWSLAGSYRLEWGAGGLLNSGDLRVGWDPGGRFALDVTTSALQQFEEYRLGEGVLLGGGAAGRLRLGYRTSLRGGFTVFHRARSSPSSSFDGGQLRAWSEIRVALGSDPGGGR